MLIYISYDLQHLLQNIPVQFLLSHTDFNSNAIDLKSKINNYFIVTSDIQCFCLVCNPDLVFLNRFMNLYSGILQLP